VVTIGDFREKNTFFVWAFRKKEKETLFFETALLDQTGRTSKTSF
jgi:hypothetical protein